MSQQDGIEEEDQPIMDIWQDEDRVSLVILNPTIIEYEDKLTPGAKFTPESAVRIAAALLTKALDALNFEKE